MGSEKPLQARGQSHFKVPATISVSDNTYDRMLLYIIKKWITG